MHPPTDLGLWMRIAAVGSRQHVEGKEYAEWRAGPLLGRDETLDDELTRSAQRCSRLADQIAIPLRGLLWTIAERKMRSKPLPRPCVSWSPPTSVTRPARLARPDQR